MMSYKTVKDHFFTRNQKKKFFLLENNKPCRKYGKLHLNHIKHNSSKKYFSLEFLKSLAKEPMNKKVR